MTASRTKSRTRRGTAAPPARARTVAELAAALRAGERSVQRWVKRGAPRAPDGSFDVGAVRRWVRAMRNEADARRYGRHPRGGAGVAPGTDAIWLESEEADVTTRKAKAALAVLELKVAKGLVVDRDAIEEVLVDRAALLRRGLDALPRRAALKLDLTPQQVDDLASEIRDLLSLIAGSGDNADSAAAARVKPPGGEQQVAG